MPDLRKDPITGRWVIIAANRAHRPNEFLTPLHRRDADICPFCEGQESQTPPAVASYPPLYSDPSVYPWQIRVVPNLYPAVETSQPFLRQRTGLFELSAGSGVHEVIIESPRHLVSMTEQRDEEIELVFQAYRDRMAFARNQPDVIHVTIFKNVGAAAGASLEHTHSQLIGLPILPALVQEELRGAQQHFHQNGCCIFCQLIDQERQADVRLVGSSPHFVAFCPFASRCAFEMWVLPTEHASHFEEIPVGRLLELGQFVRQCIARLEGTQSCTAYNYVIHSAPFDTRAVDHYHWHIEILPRIAKAAGFEWGTGCHINSVPPEDAAMALKNVNLPRLVQMTEDISTRKTS